MGARASRAEEIPDLRGRNAREVLARFAYAGA